MRGDTGWGGKPSRGEWVQPGQSVGPQLPPFQAGSGRWLVEKVRRRSSVVAKPFAECAAGSGCAAVCSSLHVYLLPFCELRCSDVPSMRALQICWSGSIRMLKRGFGAGTQSQTHTERLSRPVSLFLRMTQNTHCCRFFGRISLCIRDRAMCGSPEGDGVK